MTIISALSGLEAFLKILQQIMGMTRELEEEQKNLVIELGNAARNTQKAIQSIREGADYDSDLETIIAKQWVKAASLLKGQENDLALKLYQKGEAWSNVRNWSDNDFKKAIENIEQVDEYVKKIIVN